MLKQIPCFFFETEDGSRGHFCGRLLCIREVDESGGRRSLNYLAVGRSVWLGEGRLGIRSVFDLIAASRMALFYEDHRPRALMGTYHIGGGGET